MPSISINGAAAITPGTSATTSRVRCQSSSRPDSPDTYPCAVILNKRSRSSPSKPFITDKMTISAATPRAMPASEMKGDERHETRLSSRPQVAEPNE